MTPSIEWISISLRPATLSITRRTTLQQAGDVPLPCGRSRAVMPPMPSDSRHLLTITDTRLTAAATATAVYASSHCLLLASRVHSLPFARVCLAHPSALPCLPACQPSSPPGEPYQRATPRLSSDHAACPPTTTDTTSSCDQATALPLRSLSHS